ncbi:hypothetical protein [Haloferax prahovense]|nr:hypothetical protein [Haloferax prahovense]
MVDVEDVVERKTDGKGNFTVDTDYADETVRVAVLGVEKGKRNGSG